MQMICIDDGGVLQVRMEVTASGVFGTSNVVIELLHSCLSNHVTNIDLPVCQFLELFKFSP